LAFAKGILDHEAMPARAVTFGTFTSINMVTSAKSDPVPEEALEKGVQLLDEELAALKSVLATTHLGPASTLLLDLRTGDKEANFSLSTAISSRSMRATAAPASTRSSAVARPIPLPTNAFW
jgi:hypothetical protein